MESEAFIDIIHFLTNDIGLSLSAIDLGEKLAQKNKISLPIALWSHGILSTDDLDKLYAYMYRTNK